VKQRPKKGNYSRNMNNILLDSRYQVETPEGVDLQVQIAGPVPRILAYSIDLSVRLVAIIIASIVMQLLGKAGMGFILVITFLLEWFYPVLFEVYRSGQTPGKKMLGIMVVNDDLTPVNWNTSLVRNLLRSADFLPFFYVGGLFCMVMNKNFQRLGDFAAGTIVVYRESETNQLPLPDVPSRAPSTPLDLDDQIAIISFTQRYQQLTESRQEELANILEGMTGSTGSKGVKQVQGIGNWLLGDHR